MIADDNDDGYNSLPDEVTSPAIDDVVYSPTSPDVFPDAGNDHVVPPGPLPVAADASLALACHDDASPAGAGYSSVGSEDDSSDQIMPVADAPPALDAEAIFQQVQSSVINCYDALSVVPKQSRGLSNLCLNLLAAQTEDDLIKPFTASDTGRSFGFLCERLESSNPRRANTWTALGDSAQGAEGRDAGPSMQLRCMEFAQLVFLTSRLYLAAFAAKMQRAVSESGQYVGICALLAGQSDEACFRLRVQRQTVCSKAGSPPASSVLDQLRNAKPSLKKGTTDARDKVVYTELAFTTVIKHRTTSKYYITRGDVCMPLQHVDKATAETLDDVQYDAYALPGLGDQSFESSFKDVFALHCQDRYSANLKQASAFRERDRKLKRKRKRLDLPCDIHLCVAILTRMWALCSSFISGLLAVAISMRAPGR